MEIVSCPRCGVPAEISAWWVTADRRDPVEHVVVSCVRGHWYLLPREMVEPPRVTASS
ncbi:MAG TPA: hypothetical protein VF314_07170 [Actinomycetes bacterium]